MSSTASHGKMLRCEACNSTLPYSSYSKTKLNKIQKGLPTTIRCIRCVEKEEEDIATLSARQNKKKRKVKEKAKADDPECKKSRHNSTKASQPSDPSMAYIRNPLEAPLAKDALRYFSSMDIKFERFVGPVTGWRTVAKLAVRCKIDSDGKAITEIGLFEPDSHNVIPASGCTAHHPSINLAVTKVEHALRCCGVNGYIEGLGADIIENQRNKTYLKYLVLSVERKSGKVQMSLVWNANPTNNDVSDQCLQALTEYLLKPTEQGGLGTLLHSLWVNFNPCSRYNNAIMGREDGSWKMIAGKKVIKEVCQSDMKCPPKLRFPPMVFRQGNIDAFSNIICSIRRWISTNIIGEFQRTTMNQWDNSRGNTANTEHHIGLIDENCNSTSNTATSLLPRCVELYGGVGMIGLNCLDLFTFLSCSDENPYNLECFNKTVKKMDPSLNNRAEYTPMCAAKIASSGGMCGYDVVLVDPPRKGLDDEVIEALLFDSPSSASSSTSSSKLQWLIYISCGFKAFKRDTARLLGNDESNTGYGDVYNGRKGIKEKRRRRMWKIVHAEGHVLFPGADHIETLAIFKVIS